MIFKDDRIMNEPFSRLWERLNVIWIHYMSGFHLNNRDNKYLLGKGPKKSKCKLFPKGGGVD